ncbi:helix-turn-helix domain-containing protein [Pseudoneobacillus sp. C159]
MADTKLNSQLGLLLSKLLKERSLSMRKLCELTDIDTATISRIMNGKRKPKLEHLQKFALCLGVPISELLEAAGFPMEPKQVHGHTDFHESVNSIQSVLEASDLYDKNFSIANVEQKLADYQQYAQTEEGKKSILKSFGEKLQKVGSIGPFISQLKEMYELFCSNKGTSQQIAIVGSALIYFILSVDVIPDYIFPIGYLDDAMAVQIVSRLLPIK